ncbi:T9SS type A sorting domain-containing protein [bacterium]|nr:T9SS type A sorting domain-containing protein [bacterium]
MRKGLFFAAVLMLTLFAGSAMAQTVDVTFVINTATVPDTLWPDEAFVQMRGDTSPLTWDNTSPVVFTNAGGDYWTATVAFPENTTVNYKLFTNAVDSEGDNANKGWENDIDPDGNRVLTTGTTNMTVPVQFVNGSPDRQEQFWTPWPPQQDSIAVWVRVNMQGWEGFNAATQFVGVRGAASPDYLGNLSWGHTNFLTQEQPHGNGGSRQYSAGNFYSGLVLIPKDEVTDGQTIEYKFVIVNSNDPDEDPATWESRNNRTFNIPVGKADTTLMWSWFDDVRPVPFVGSDTIVVNYTVDMSTAIQERGFRTGDTLFVQAGWSGTARNLAGESPTRTILTKQGFTNTYVASDTLVLKKGDRVFYQYYVQKDGQDIRETYFNFAFEESSDPLAERRFFTPDADNFDVMDTEDSRVSANRMPRFRNTSVLSQPVTVTWELDVRPAIYQVLAGDTLVDIQGNDSVIDPASILTNGAWMNGPATGGWTTWGLTLREDLPKKMYDDGTNGDAVAGDSVFTVQIMYAPDSTGSKKFIGQEYKFGINGGDNEGGFGNNHIANIDDSQDEVTILTQWGSIDPNFYDAWDFDLRQPKPQSVEVTFMVNTATVPDTLWPDQAFVQMRGDTAPLTWDNTSPVVFTNAGGDYWMAKVEFPANTTVNYKLFTNAVDGEGDNANKGWENDIDPDGNRVLTTGNSDMMVPVQFVNGSPERQEQFWTPWPPQQDSIAVWVRVNMQGWEGFSSATQYVGVRGAASPDYLGNLSWGHTLFLNQEEPHGNGGSRQYTAGNFYSGLVLIPKDEVSDGQTIEYKFVIVNSDDPDEDPATWESRNNRTFNIPVGMADTTLQWVWFDDVRPVPFVGSDTINVNYTVDMSTAIQERGFRTGDTLFVQAGWSGTARNLAGESPTRTILTKQGFTNTYVGSETLVLRKGDRVFYQYYVQKDGQDIRETYFNFDFEDSSDPLAERRYFTPETDDVDVMDTEDSRVSANRMPRFRNTSVLSRAVTVTWELDLRPAFYQVLAGDTLVDIQGVENVTTTEFILNNGVWMNGPATGGWTTWGLTLREDLPKMMVDDGTNGDAVAGDSIYTVQMMYAPDSTGSKQFVGQEYKFGINGGDNEGGFGNNHIANIDDSQDEVTIRTQWGSIDPNFYDAWDFDAGGPKVTSVSRLDVVPAGYTLEQNYPNPFNPTTTITYSITRSENVTVKLYDALGNEVGTLINRYQTPGTYQVTLDAADLGSGTYFYRMTAGSFSQIRKMTLVK